MFLFVNLIKSHNTMNSLFIDEKYKEFKSKYFNLNQIRCPKDYNKNTKYFSISAYGIKPDEDYYYYSNKEFGIIPKEIVNEHKFRLNTNDVRQFFLIERKYVMPYLLEIPNNWF